MEDPLIRKLVILLTIRARKYGRIVPSGRLSVRPPHRPVPVEILKMKLLLAQAIWAEASLVTTLAAGEATVKDLALKTMSEM